VKEEEEGRKEQEEVSNRERDPKWAVKKSTETNAWHKK
jgi:hypothetical protein